MGASQESFQESTLLSVIAILKIYKHISIFSFQSGEKCDWTC